MSDAESDPSKNENSFSSSFCYLSAKYFRIPRSRVIVAMASAANKFVIQRRGSLIQRRNSKRFVLSELGATENTTQVPENGRPFSDSSSENHERDDFVSLNDDDGSDDDDAFKVPDIVLDIPLAQETATTTPVGFYLEETEYPSQISDWHSLKRLKNGFA